MAEQSDPPAADSEVEQPVCCRRSTIGSKGVWIVAGFFALVVLGVIGYFIVPPFSSEVVPPSSEVVPPSSEVLPPPSERTRATSNPEILKIKRVDISPTVVLGSVPAAPGNAAVDYNSAVMAMETHLDVIGKYIGEDDDLDDDNDPMSRWNIPPKAITVLQQIASHVQAGAQKGDMKYTFIYTPKRFEVGYFCKPANDLEKLSNALDTLAANYVKQKKYAEAESVLKAEFAMGWHMMKEGIRADMAVCGLRVQDMALSGLRGLYKEWPGDHAKRIKNIEEYRNSVRDVQQAYREKRKIVWNVRPNPGDVFYIIENDEDRVWRLQGLLMLGLIRFTARDNRGDMRMIEQLVKKHSTGNDPYLAAAAKAARDFTKEDFNQIGIKMY